MGEQAAGSQPAGQELKASCSLRLRVDGGPAEPWLWQQPWHLFTEGLSFPICSFLPLRPLVQAGFLGTVTHQVTPDMGSGPGTGVLGKISDKV